MWRWTRPLSAPAPPAPSPWQRGPLEAVWRWHYISGAVGSRRERRSHGQSWLRERRGSRRRASRLPDPQGERGAGRRARLRPLPCVLRALAVGLGSVRATSCHSRR